jgi:hypothetical protein
MKPTRWKIRSFCVILFSLTFILSLGCASKEEKKTKHLQRARQSVEKNELKKAVIEYKNVIQLDPGDDTWEKPT